jgi:hypothetical protein
MPAVTPAAETILGYVCFTPSLIRLGARVKSKDVFTQFSKVLKVPWICRLTEHDLRQLLCTQPTKDSDQIPFFPRNTLTLAPRNNLARYTKKNASLATLMSSNLQILRMKILAKLCEV